MHLQATSNGEKNLLNQQAVGQVEGELIEVCLIV